MIRPRPIARQPVFCRQRRRIGPDECAPVTRESSFEGGRDMQMTLVTILGAALSGGTWGALLVWLLLRLPMRRQAVAAEALQRGVADLQGQYWALRQCLPQASGAPAAPPVPDNPTGAGLERLYDRAIRMARQGAPVDALTGSCGLSQAEAELVVRLHATPTTATRKAAGA